MSSTSKAWMVAASIGVVEALKDQGLCRWNHALRLIQQNAKNNIRSYSHRNPKMLSSYSTPVVASAGSSEKLKKAEDSLRTVIYLSCWGPN